MFLEGSEGPTEAEIHAVQAFINDYAPRLDALHAHRAKAATTGSAGAAAGMAHKALAMSLASDLPRRLDPATAARIDRYVKERFKSRVKIIP